MTTEEKYVLIKRDLFWRPNSQGYTGALAQAGNYNADDISGRPMLDAYDPKREWEETYALPKSAAPEFTKACCVYVQRDALKAERDKYKAEALVNRALASDGVIADNCALRSANKQLVEALEAFLVTDWSRPSTATAHNMRVAEQANAAIHAAKAKS